MMEKEHKVDETMLQFVKPLTYKVLQKISQVGLPRPNLTKNRSHFTAVTKMSHKQGSLYKTTQPSDHLKKVIPQPMLTSTLKPIKSI